MSGTWHHDRPRTQTGVPHRPLEATAFVPDGVLSSGRSVGDVRAIGLSGCVRTHGTLALRSTPPLAHALPAISSATGKPQLQQLYGLLTSPSRQESRAPHCGCVWPTQRSAQQRHSLQLLQAADFSGIGPSDVLNGLVAADSTSSPTGFGLSCSCMVYRRSSQIWAEYRVANVPVRPHGMQY